MLYNILQLRTATEKSDAMFDREKAQERLSKLSGGVAVFKVKYSSYQIPPLICASYNLLCKYSFSCRLEGRVKRKLEREKIGLQML